MSNSSKSYEYSAHESRWPDLQPLRLMLVAVTVDECLFELRMAAELKRRGEDALVVCRDSAVAMQRRFSLEGYPVVPSEICGLPSLLDEASGVHVLSWEAVVQAVSVAPVKDIVAAGLALEEHYDIPNWQIETVSEHYYEEGDPAPRHRHVLSGLDSSARPSVLRQPQPVPAGRAPP
jgi:hypothetical protein